MARLLLTIPADIKTRGPWQIAADHLALFETRADEREEPLVATNIVGGESAGEEEAVDAFPVQVLRLIRYNHHDVLA